MALASKLSMELIMTESIFKISVEAAVAKKVIRLYFSKELLNPSGNCPQEKSSLNTPSHPM